MRHCISLVSSRNFSKVGHLGSTRAFSNLFIYSESSISEQTIDQDKLRAGNPFHSCMSHW
uniref:Uncharacterized protein n=1 Tax=Utricularia reniformis TaxID=192314 RepID=A0A1Y0B335_9LAMI|nr:hypothetical protein AEK19_MT1612 [Utricularia reniformis]ART31797.1 hypothetical protein AEK19_MT1612 [Utricularia reniformis]